MSARWPEAANAHGRLRRVSSVVWVVVRTNRSLAASLVDISAQLDSMDIVGHRDGVKVMVQDELVGECCNTV